MRRRKINGRCLSDKLPARTSKSAVDAEEFSSALEKFADEYLRGAVEITVSGRSQGYASVSAEMTAYMLRTAMENTKDDEVLRIEISLGDNLTLKISYEYDPDSETVASVIGIARIAGFVAQRCENTITLTSCITDSSTIKIYAISKNEIANHLYEIFFL